MVTSTTPIELTGPVDCACVIHGDTYSWDYVERLYSMLNRNLTQGIRMHVYTEADRPVPEPMHKHVLEDWGISGPKKSWWYKMQLFNSAHHAGPLLYFDLDVVVLKNIDWITKLPLRYFWGLRDFKHLWRPTSYNINSSVMWWDTTKFDYIWKNFSGHDLPMIMRKYTGDQDYITEAILEQDRKFFDLQSIQSWRWQCLDGGYNFIKRRYFNPGTGTRVSDQTSVLVFHGQPKPSEITDPLIVQHWQ